MLYKNKYNKVILTIILSLCSSCHLSTALAVNEPQVVQLDAEAQLELNALRKAEAKINFLTAMASTRYPALAVEKAERVQVAASTLINKIEAQGALAHGDTNEFRAAMRCLYLLAQAALDHGDTNESHEAMREPDLLAPEAWAKLVVKEETASEVDDDSEADDDSGVYEDAIDDPAILVDQAIKILDPDSTGQTVHPEAREVPKSQEALAKQEETAAQVEKDNQQLHRDQQNRPEVVKVQEKLQIAQAPIEAQTYAVQNIAAIQSSIASNIADTRMNINQYSIRASEDENKPVAAGSQTVDAYITPKSWDIWASGHMGNIKQDAADAISSNSKTDFYGGSIGIDKIFANNSVFGLALSYGKSNTEYTSQTGTGVTANEKWESNYYQANAYIHHNFTDNLFVQLIGGIGTYGDGTTIGNMFDFSSQESTFGYHGNATIGYSIFGGEDSNFAITPKLGVAYYHLNIPDSILGKTDSSTFTTLSRFDGIAGLNIKILNLNSNSDSNVKIIPEITAAFKLRLSNNVEGINADNIKLPVAKGTDSNDLSANVLATPEQLFTLGGALTIVTNNNFSISLNGSVDFATQYSAMVGGISVKLSF